MAPILSPYVFCLVVCLSLPTLSEEEIATLPAPPQLQPRYPQECSSTPSPPRGMGASPPRDRSSTRLTGARSPLLRSAGQNSVSPTSSHPISSPLEFSRRASFTVDTTDRSDDGLRLGLLVNGLQERVQAARRRSSASNAMFKRCLDDWGILGGGGGLLCISGLWFLRHCM